MANTWLHEKFVVEIIQKAHIEIGHGGGKTYKNVSEKFANVPRSVVAAFITQCDRCIEKRRRQDTTSGVVV
jgi:hypothetical protein